MTAATTAAFAYAAATGRSAVLPAAVANDPLLERYILEQPADQTSQERALVDWRRAAASAGTAELVDILSRQYQASPSDTPESRVLRYQLAAITRDQIKRKGGVLPPTPSTIAKSDQSDQPISESRSSSAGSGGEGQPQLSMRSPNLPAPSISLPQPSNAAGG